MLEIEGVNFNIAIATYSLAEDIDSVNAGQLVYLDNRQRLRLYTGAPNQTVLGILGDDWSAEDFDPQELQIEPLAEVVRRVTVYTGDLIALTDQYDIVMQYESGAFVYGGTDMEGEPGKVTSIPAYGGQPPIGIVLQMEGRLLKCKFRFPSL